MNKDDVDSLISYQANLRKYISDAREEVITKITYGDYKIRAHASYRPMSAECLYKLQQELYLISSTLYGR